MPEIVPTAAPPSSMPIAAPASSAAPANASGGKKALGGKTLAEADEALAPKYGKPAPTAAPPKAPDPVSWAGPGGGAKPPKDLDNRYYMIKRDPLAALYTGSSFARKVGELNLLMAQKKYSEAEKMLADVEATQKSINDAHEVFVKAEKQLGWLDAKAKVASVAADKPANDARAAILVRLANRFALPGKDLVTLRNDIQAQNASANDAVEKNFRSVEGNDAHASAMLDDLLAKGVIKMGRCTRAYPTSWDKDPGEFSVEYTVDGLDYIVLHAHVASKGWLKADNGVHWKPKLKAKEAGNTHPISAKARAALINKSEVEAFASDPKTDRRKH